MGEQKTFLQRLKNFTIWVCGIYACLLIFDFAYVHVFGQSPQTTLTVVTYSNIVGASKLDGCDPTHPCIDNRSAFIKQSSTSSYRAIGNGTWSVDMQFADGVPLGWTSFGSTAQVNQATPPSGVGYGIGPSSIQKPYHDYIRFVMTGNVTILNYSGTRQFWWLPSVAAVAFPITPSQGGINGVNVQQYGASCDGVTDDTASVQAAANALGTNGTLFLCKQSVISNVYIPESARGAVITAIKSGTSAYEESSPNTAGFIAKSGTTGAMFTVYAPGVNIKNLWLNCASHATNGIIYQNATAGLIENVGSANCIGDGIQVNPFAGTATTLASSINSGISSGTFTVSNAVLTGQILGSLTCPFVVLQYSNSSQDFLSVSGSGNTMTITGGTTAHSHSIGSSIQCAGSNNSLILNSIQSLLNGGWGLNIFEGQNNNAIVINDPFMFGNTSGGSLLSGSVGKQSGGHYEANGGPSVQLGDLNGGGANGVNGRLSAGWEVGQLTDDEGNTPDGVTSICDTQSTVRFAIVARITAAAAGGAGPFCPSLPAGVGTLAYGLSNQTGSGSPQMTVWSALGVCTIQPGSGGAVACFDSSGTQLALPYYSSTLSVSGAITAHQMVNYAIDSGANNNLAITLKDSLGNNIPLDSTTNGMRIEVWLQHTLAGSSGSNTITVNGGSPLGIFNHRALGSLTLTNGYGFQTMIDLVWNNAGGYMQDMSQ